MGRGSFGEVREAISPHHPGVMAAKIPNTPFKDEDMVEISGLEAMRDCKAVAKLVDSFFHDDKLVLVMEKGDMDLFDMLCEQDPMEKHEIQVSCLSFERLSPGSFMKYAIDPRVPFLRNPS